MLFRKLLILTPAGRSRHNAVIIVRHLQHDVAHYLATVTAINAGLGALTAVALWAIGMPDPALWGALVAVIKVTCDHVEELRPVGKLLGR